MIIKIYLKDKASFYFFLQNPFFEGCQGPLPPLDATLNVRVVLWVGNFLQNKDHKIMISILYLTLMSITGYLGAYPGMFY